MERPRFVVWRRVDAIELEGFFGIRVDDIVLGSWIDNNQRPFFELYGDSVYLCNSHTTLYFDQLSGMRMNLCSNFEILRCNAHEHKLLSESGV